MFVRCDKFFACKLEYEERTAVEAGLWEVDSISTLREDRRGTKWSHVQFYLHSSNLKSNGIKNLSFNFNKAEGQVISFERKRWDDTMRSWTRWVEWIQIENKNASISVVMRLQNTALSERAERRWRRLCHGGAGVGRWKPTGFNYPLRAHNFQSEFRRLWGSSIKLQEREISKWSGWVIWMHRNNTWEKCWSCWT